MPVRFNHVARIIIKRESQRELNGCKTPNSRLRCELSLKPQAAAAETHLPQLPKP